MHIEQAIPKNISSIRNNSNSKSNHNDLNYNLNTKSAKNLMSQKNIKKNNILSKKSQQQLIQHIQQLEKYLFNNELSSISSASQQYYPPVKQKPKKQHVHRQKQKYRKIQQQQLILVPKSKLMKLFQSVKILKKALKSQQAMMRNQLSNLRSGLNQVNQEKILLKRQQEYLKDMYRTRSQGKIGFYRTEGGFYHN